MNRTFHLDEINGFIYTYFLRCLVRGYGTGFGGLEVACWPLVPKFAGSNPTKPLDFSGRKNPQHAFLRRGSKAVCPMKQIYGM